MGRCMRKCKGIGEIAVMEVAAAAHQVGVMTRARALAMAAASGRVQKRKSIGSQELEYSTASYVRLRSRRRLVITPENRSSPANSGSSGRVIMSSGCSSPCSDQAVASRCSSNGSRCELVTETFKRSVADLKGEGLEIESSTCSGCRERREATPSSDLRAESDDLELMERPISVANSGHRSREVKMPSAAEMEEFFSAAETEEQKRFAEKYNYDIVKDAPLEGRYEWVELKP